MGLAVKSKEKKQEEMKRGQKEMMRQEAKQ